MRKWAVHLWPSGQGKNYFIPSILKTFVWFGLWPGGLGRGFDPRLLLLTEANLFASGTQLSKQRFFVQMSPRHVVSSSIWWGVGGGGGGLTGLCSAVTPTDLRVNILFILYSLNDEKHHDGVWVKQGVLRESTWETMHRQYNRRVKSRYILYAFVQWNQKRVLIV